MIKKLNRLCITFLMLICIVFSQAFGKSFYSPQNNQLNIMGPHFVLACSMGLIEGCKTVRKFAKNGNLASNIKRDVWDFGAADLGNVDYKYPEDGTAPINKVSSSNAGDVQNIAIFGLDIEGNDVAQVVTLQGQTSVTLPTSLWRVYRVVNIDSQTTADRSIGFLGSIYVYTSSAVIVNGIPSDSNEVKAFVFDGDNQTQMSHYTVPKGYVGFIIGGSAKLSKRQSASVVYETWFRSYGSVFRLIDTSALNSVGSGIIQGLNPIPQAIPELTDIVLAGISDSNDVGIAASYSIVLLKKSVWGI